jgi:hypothetical protein
MHKSATKCNETIGKWCKNKHGVSKIIDTLEMYQRPPAMRGPHLASHLSLPPQLFLSPKNNDTPSSNSSSYCSSPRFFDLLAQPIISAEIWSNCSLVCDSSACPSRISFDEVFLEYLSNVGGRINEYACLFYCLEMLF